MLPETRGSVVNMLTRPRVGRPSNRGSIPGRVKRFIIPSPDLPHMLWCPTTRCFPSLSRNTNKLQLCNRIYYSKVYWRLNIFQAAHRSSSGALNCICILWFIYPCGDRPLPRLSGKNGNGQSPHGYINQRLQIQFRAPDDERCAAWNMLSFQ